MCPLQRQMLYFFLEFLFHSCGRHSTHSHEGETNDTTHHIFRTSIRSVTIVRTYLFSSRVHPTSVGPHRSFFSTDWILPQNVIGSFQQFLDLAHRFSSRLYHGKDVLLPTTGLDHGKNRESTCFFLLHGHTAPLCTTPAPPMCSLCLRHQWIEIKYFFSFIYKYLIEY